MKNTNSFKLALILILFLALVLRVYKIDRVPAGLTWDEAALGYNAYSILKTGRDEYGNFLPLHLKSFGDYKPAIYSYLTIPAVAIFGLNELSVRLVSAIFGSLTILLLYILTKKLFQDRLLSLFCAFFLAINPLSIHFSRGAWEANVAVFFNLLGFYLFIKGLKESQYFIFSALTFLTSLFTYQSSRLFVPLFIMGLLIIFRKEIKFSKTTIVALIIFLFSFFLIFKLVFLSGNADRLKVMNLFSYTRSEETIKEISSEDNYDKGSLFFLLLHGEWWSHIKGVVERYLIYFSPKMLFISGDYSQRHRVPDLGILFYFSLISITLGIYYLLKRYKDKAVLVLFMLAISIIPAVLSRDLISILRALNLIIPLAILEGLGFYFLYIHIVKFKPILKFLSMALILLIVIVNFAVFLDRYFIHLNKEYSKHWMYSYKDVIIRMSNINKNYNNIIYTDFYGQPYIYYLFFTKYSPEKFQKQALLEKENIDTGTIRKIDNIEFRSIYWPKDRFLKNNLYIGTLEQLPDKDIKPFPEYNILGEFEFLDKEKAFRMVETN